MAGVCFQQDTCIGFTVTGFLARAFLRSATKSPRLCRYCVTATPRKRSTKRARTIPQSLNSFANEYCHYRETRLIPGNPSSAIQPANHHATQGSFLVLCKLSGLDLSPGEAVASPTIRQAGSGCLRGLDGCCRCFETLRRRPWKNGSDRGLQRQFGRRPQSRRCSPLVCELR